MRCHPLQAPTQDTQHLDAPNKPNEPDQPNQPQYNALVLAVPHQVFREKEPEAFLTLLKDEDGPGVLVDVKGHRRDRTPGRGTRGAFYWRL